MSVLATAGEGAAVLGAFPAVVTGADAVVPTGDVAALGGALQPPTSKDPTRPTIANAPDRMHSSFHFRIQLRGRMRSFASCERPRATWCGSMVAGGHHVVTRSAVDAAMEVGG